MREEGWQRNSLVQPIFLFQGYLIWSIVFSTDVLSEGVWQTLAELQDPELKRLAGLLPATVLRSRADSTTKKYMAAFQRWRAWAEPRQEIRVYPVDEAHFALYLQHVGESTQAKSAVEEAVNAVGWIHQLSGIPPISGSSFVRATMDGLRRKLAKPKVKKEPVTLDMLSALVRRLTPTSSLADVRLAASSLLAYAAFLRYDELAKLRCCDISITAESMSVHITSSKTDQYRQGDSVLIVRTSSATCPVAMMERYFRLGGMESSSKRKLFRGIVHTKSGERLRAAGGLSYTRMRELFLQKIAELGFDPKRFGLHSLRAGGASAAANAGVPDRLFKRHGRWKSESAKDGYIKDSVASRLSVSKKLNL